MKKIILLVVFFCSVISLYAQEGQSLAKAGLDENRNVYSAGYWIGLAIVLTLGSIFAFKALTSNKKKALKATAEKQSATLPEPGNYEFVLEPYAPYKQYYRSLLNDKLRVQIIIPKPNDSENVVILATSFAHGISETQANIMMGFMPELINVNWEKSHELIIYVSRAVNFEDLRSSILKFLFTQLDQKYDWMHEEQKIYIEKETIYKDQVSFFIKTEVFNYWRLRELLLNIEGVASVMGQSSTVKFDVDYGVRVYMDKPYFRTRLIAEIKKIFSENIRGGVEFVES